MLARCWRTSAMLMENGIWGAPDAFVKREGSERVWGHLAAQDAGEAHINIVLAAFVPASYLAVAPLSHWPDVLSAARHPGSRASARQSCQSLSHVTKTVTDKTSFPHILVIPFFPWRRPPRAPGWLLGVLFRSLRLTLARTSRTPSAGRRQQALLVLKHAVAALERVESIRVPDAAVRPYVQRVVRGLGLPVGSVTWRGAASHGAGVGRGRGRGRRLGRARGRGGAGARGAPTCCPGWRPGSGRRSS